MNRRDHCLQLIQDGQVKEVLNFLQAHSRGQDKDQNLTLVQISARYHRLMREKQLGILAKSELDIEHNQISYHLIEFVQTLFPQDFSQPDPPYPGSRLRILFASAQAIEHQLLSVDAEFRAIEDVLRASTNRDRFELRRIAALRPEDLLKELMRFKPHFFHFSGHGSPGSIYLVDNDNAARPLSKAQLVDIFRFFRDTIGCAFLNACYSTVQAEAIHQYIPFVIGTSEAIQDNVAIHYATQFYEAIGEGEDVGYAFAYANLSASVAGGERNVLEMFGGNEDQELQ